MVRGHFDGEAIRLDEPLAMEANTKVVVAILAPQPVESDGELWARLARLNLERAYGVEEPDYSMAMLKEPNPAYEGQRSERCERSDRSYSPSDCKFCSTSRALGEPIRVKRARAS